MASVNPAPLTRLIGSSSRYSSFLGSLYTFVHHSANAHDKTPVVLVCSRNDGMIFKSRSGNRYIAGVNVSYMTPGARTVILRMFGHKNPVTYQDIKRIINVSGKYRIYNYSNVSHLSVVNVDEYIRQFGISEE